MPQVDAAASILEIKEKLHKTHDYGNIMKEREEGDIICTYRTNWMK